MNLSLLTPVLVPLLSWLVFGVSGSIDQKKSQRGVNNKFKCSKVVVAFLWLGATGISLFFLISVVVDPPDRWISWMMMVSFQIFLFACSIYASRLAVVLADRELIYRGFVVVRVPYSDIVSLNMRSLSQGGSQLVLLLSSGSRLRLSSYLKSFGEMTDVLQARTGLKLQST
jgi:hypothetical protein